MRSGRGSHSGSNDKGLRREERDKRVKRKSDKGSRTYSAGTQE